MLISRLTAQSGLECYDSHTFFITLYGGTSMQDIFKNYLFSKQILVNDTNICGEEAFSVMLSMAKLFNIRLTNGRELATVEHIRFVSKKLGENVSAPFYREFPRSVLALSFNDRLLDQLLHYHKTYGCGDFGNPSHSVFEESFERTALKQVENCKDFVVVSESDAVNKLKGYVEAAMKSTRPLNDSMYNLVLEYMKEYKLDISECPCKDTAVRLLLDTGDYRYANFISFSDILKLVEYINLNRYNNANNRKLNFKNQDRKLVKTVLDKKLEAGECNIQECFEKQDRWCGLLHHIHYKPQNELGKSFVKAMREEFNGSVYAKFEKEMGNGNIQKALLCLREGKGSGAVIRNLDYMLSRCTNPEDLDYVLEHMHTENPILLLQLYMHYVNYNDSYCRTFRFTRNATLVVHRESFVEARRRKTFISNEVRCRLVKIIMKNLKEIYCSKLGRVYIHEKMRKIALPLQEGTATGGFGILPKGSRISLRPTRILRCFTYWEGVDDVDLSVIGLSEDGKQHEFSWRTMAGKNSPEIVYSGDITDGFKGASEYFDIDATLFKCKYPQIRYLVFCNNVYSRVPFRSFDCKAGYMVREDGESGEIFEPKTVESAFAINSDSMFAYLFAIDMESNELVWLNVANSMSVQVAGTTRLDFLFDYLNMTSIINVYDLFEMLATKIVDNPVDADVVVTDENVLVKEGTDCVTSRDIDKIIAYMNKK